ncbi:DNA polymerase III subunit gamma and tau, partial [Streptomyces sp. NPDC056949]
TAAPTGGGAGGGAGGGQPSAAAPTPPPAQPQPQAPAQPPAAAPPAAGGLDPRSLWPNILEVVKNKRRFTWILLSQNAQVTGFDGTTLQLGFLNAGARDNFASSGSEDVLRTALAEQFGVHWKVEAVVDPSGGGGGGGQAPPPAPGGGYPGHGGGGAPAAPTSPRPPAPQAQAPAAPRPPDRSAPQASAPAPAPAARPAAPEPPPVSIEDDIPADDDPDLDESVLSGHDLIVRELGATVVEEFTNE